MKYYFRALKNYANFRGCSTRKEYWLFVLFNIIFSITAAILDLILTSVAVDFSEAVEVFAQMGGVNTPYTQIYFNYTLLLLIPSLAIVVRRLHDIGKSGWTIFIAAIPLVGQIWFLILLCQESKQTDNKYASLEKKKADKTAAQWLKINITVSVFRWALEILINMIVPLLLRWAVIFRIYMSIAIYISYLQLGLTFVVWITWLLVILQLMEPVVQKSKKLVIAAFSAFLASEVFFTIISTLIIRNQRSWDPSNAMSLVALQRWGTFINVIWIASIVLSYLALKQIAIKGSNGEKKIAISLYLYMVPSALLYLFLLVKPLQIILYRYGINEIAYIYMRVLIVVTSIAAAIILMLSKIKEQQPTSTIEKSIGFSDNRGLRLISEEQANTHWTVTYVMGAKSSPVLIVRFDQYHDLLKVLGDISFLHWSEATTEYISSEVVEYGYYRIGTEDMGEFILCGTDLTLEDWQEAKDVLTAAGGKIWQSREPEIHKKLAATSVNMPCGIKFKEKRVDGRYTYEIYTGNSKEEALVFLDGKMVSQGLYYIVVETPEGNYGKDIQGVYKE